jgi:hypothetical protein
MAVLRGVKRRERMTLQDEIADTERRDQHEPVGISISVTRGLFLHALRAMRDGDYGSVSAYISDLIRRDKHIQNSKPPNLDAPLHQPTIPPQSSPDKHKLKNKRQHRHSIASAAE